MDFLIPHKLFTVANVMYILVTSLTVHLSKNKSNLKFKISFKLEIDHSNIILAGVNPFFYFFLKKVFWSTFRPLEGLF